MAVHLLDQARLMHERAIEDHNLIAFHHAVREPNHTPTGLCERVDERNFLIVQGDEHIVVGKQPGELGNGPQLIPQLSGIVGHHKQVAGEQHLRAHAPLSPDPLLHFVLGNERLLNKVLADQLFQQVEHLLLLPADRLHDIPHATTSPGKTAENTQTPPPGAQWPGGGLQDMASPWVL